MTRIGRYELGPLLGFGGAGKVYRAVLHGPGGLRRPVALKVLHGGTEELRREARIGGLLRHRNLDRVCARIDPNDDVVETSSADNFVGMDAGYQLYVYDDGDPGEPSCPPTINPGGGPL